MKNETLIRIAAAAVVGFAGAAFAADNADKNSDGKITKAEAASNPDLARDFAKLDANKDGSLDTSEYAKFEVTGKVGNESGSEAKNPDVEGTTNDSTAGNKDMPGPGR